MSKLHRYFAPNQCCFVTAVTYNRKRTLDLHTEQLLGAVHNAKRKSRFTVIAWVVLPDHFHAVLNSPNGDIPKIMQRIKLSFSLQYKRLSGVNGPIWQHRYWDHIIRSEEDLRQHINYIHYNPIKHGLTDSPKKWPLSSFHRYFQKGFYDDDWGEKRIMPDGDMFGE